MINQTELSKLKGKAARGAMWIFLFSSIGLPLLYVRNWFLGRIGPEGEVAGVFALILLLHQGILTFLFFGGKNVLTTFYPKLRTGIERNGFVNRCYMFIAAGAFAGITVLLLWPEAIEWLMRKELSEGTRGVLIFLIPAALLAHIGNSILTAMQSFGLSAFLERLQLFVMTALVCLLYFLAPDLLIQKPLFILGCTIVAVCLFSALISLAKVHKRIGFSGGLWMPPNCIRFACFAHLEKIVTFGYLAIDQIFVVQKFDIARLGVYFLLLQIARIIPLTVQIFGHVVLTTFSALLGNDNEEQVVSAYRKLSRLSVWFHFALSLALILFARPIAGIFGTTYAQSYRYLVWLAVNMNIGSLYTITSMCAAAYEKMHQIFYTRLLQVALQIITTIALIGPLGVYGVIIGKGLGMLIGSMGLFIVLALCRPHDRIYPPAVFLISQFCVIPAAVYAHIYPGNWLAATALFVLGLLVFSIAGKYRWQEFMAVVNLVRSKTSE